MWLAAIAVAVLKHVDAAGGLKVNARLSGLIGDSQLHSVDHFVRLLGLVEVAYQMRRTNHHLKIFAAIRKEAYARLPQRTAMSQQYRGSAVAEVGASSSIVVLIGGCLGDVHGLLLRWEKARSLRTLGYRTTSLVCPKRIFFSASV